MLYETRKVIVGFRLKLNFDLSLNKDMSCIFVEVSKTATVGLLLNNIIERFKIPHNSFLTVQNCKVLPSESVYVLLDINSAKVNVPSESINEQLGTQSSNVLLEVSTSKQTSDVIPCDEGDVVDGKSESFLKPRPPRKPRQDGIAATIKMLLQEKEMEEIGKECSGLSISNETSKIQTSDHQEAMNVVGDEAETSLRCDELSDLPSDACSDLNIEKRKRKRKRKHSRKDEVGDKSSSSFTELVLESRRDTSSSHRKHIRFDDADNIGLSVDDEVGSNVCTPTQRFRSEQPKRKESYEKILVSPVENSVHPSTEMPPGFEQVLPGSSGDGIKQPTITTKISNHQSDDTGTLNESSTMEDNETSSANNSRVRSEDQTFSQKPIKNPNQKSKTSINFGDALTSFRDEPHKYRELSLSYPPTPRPTNSRRLYSEVNKPKIHFQTDSDQSVSSFNVTPKVIEEGDELTRARVAKELATLLMCKQLSSCMEYTVQFPNEKGNRCPSKSPSSSQDQTGSRQLTDSHSNQSTKKLDSSNSISQNVETAGNYENDLPDQREATSDDGEFQKQIINKKQIRVLKPDGTYLEVTPSINEKGNSWQVKLSSPNYVVIAPQLTDRHSNQPTKKLNSSNSISKIIKTECNYENDLPDRMEASSDDCEFLKQVKLDGTRIRFRKTDGTWTVLTPNIANVELPMLEVPKENQSIVFRIVYLNQNFIPTSSDLLYGQIVSYHANTNKLAIDIPQQFLEAIVKDCGDEVLPETIVQITGSTFEVDLSTLVEPRVIS